MKSEALLCLGVGGAQSRRQNRSGRWALGRLGQGVRLCEAGHRQEDGGELWKGKAGEKLRRVLNAKDGNLTASHVENSEP